MSEMFEDVPAGYFTSGAPRSGSTNAAQLVADFLATGKAEARIAGDKRKPLSILADVRKYLKANPKVGARIVSRTVNKGQENETLIVGLVRTEDAPADVEAEASTEGAEAEGEDGFSSLEADMASASA